MDNNSSSNNTSNPNGDQTNFASTPPPEPTQPLPAFDQGINPAPPSQPISDSQSQFAAQTATPAFSNTITQPNPQPSGNEIFPPTMPQPESSSFPPADITSATFATGDLSQNQGLSLPQTPLPSFGSISDPSIDPTNQAPLVATSPLDSQPATPPSFDAPLPSGSIPTDPASPTPTFGSLPEQMPQTSQPIGANGEPSEPAPTDLSQLTINNNDQSSQPASDIYNPTVAAPETLVIPTPAGATQADTPATQTTPPTQKPKIILLVALALILLLIVGAASAYFILGIGKSPQTSTSLPLSQPSQPPLTKPPSQNPTPIPISQDDASGVASRSASFGDLNGSTSISSASPSPKTASSAADLLKARQNSSPRP